MNRQNPTIPIPPPVLKRKGQSNQDYQFILLVVFSAVATAQEITDIMQVLQSTGWTVEFNLTTLFTDAPPQG
jgi:hypothetical protein